MTSPFAALEEPTAAELNRAVQKIVARGKRVTNSATTTTEIGVLRLDNVSLKQGYLYLIFSGTLLVDGSTNDNNVGARLRMSTSGAAGTGSTQIAQSNYDQDVQTASEAISPLMASYTPAADETGSFLISAAAFIGAPTVQMLGSATAPIELFVMNMGIDPGDTGVDI
ncbi:MAG TPA: hypothetical protein VFC00_03525 [Micromonosporaceae bacterium]|nr:hypothetical protein [Micromonosporaceae bacterium]